MRRTLAVLSMMAMILATRPPMSAAPSPDHAAVQQFNRLVTAYMALHERVEQPLPPLRVSADVREIDQAVDAMARAVRAARSDAKAGDIFTPEVAVEFRRRLEEGIRSRGYDPADLLAHIAEENAEEELAPDVTLAINQPLGCGLAMTPPFVLDVLPALPVELQYRFVARNLALFDTHAELVVDILHDALPEK